MTTYLRSIDLALFKGFKKTTVEFSKGLNLLVGGNNSGKSSILHGIYLAFHFLKLTQGINEINSKKGKDKQQLKGISIKGLPLPFHEESYISEGLKKRTNRSQSTMLTANLGKSLSFRETVTFPGGNLLIISSDSDGGSGSVDYRKSIDKIIKKEKNLPLFIPTFSGVANKEEIKTAEVVKYYLNSGKSSEVLRNQLKVINQNKAKLERLNNYLEKGFGVKMVLNSTKDIYLSSLYRENEYEGLDISSAGSGFQQILQILVYIVATNANLILIDEPDAHLHYKLQSTLYEILLEIVRDGKQVILATHSQIFIKKSIQNNDFLILVDKGLERQRTIEEYSDGLKILYEKGVIDEKEVIRGASLKIVDLEDSSDGNGFKIMNEFLSKLDIKEPKFRIISGTDSVFDFHKTRTKIDGIKLKTLVFRDGDGLNDQHLKILEKNKTKNDLQLTHLRVHEVENYLLNHKVISRVLKSKGAKLSKNKVQKIINELIEVNRDSILDLLEGALQGKLEKEYRELGVNYKDVFTVEVPKRKKEIRENFFHSPFIFLPGKEIFRLLKQKIHTLYGIKISEIEVARAFKKTEVPEEIKQALLFLK